jgi:hypothetical protein
VVTGKKLNMFMIVRSEHILRAEKKGVVCQYKLTDAEREIALKNAR